MFELFMIRVDMNDMLSCELNIHKAMSKSKLFHMKDPETF